MKILLLGSGGYIGRHLLTHLKENGSVVVALSSSTPGWITPETGEVAGDFSIERDVDAVVYLAQSPYYRDATLRVDHLMNVNVRSALIAAEHARRAGVRRFIYTSTGNVYAQDFAPLGECAPLCRSDWYALSKIQAEEGLALFRDHMDVHILRLFGIYGPAQEARLVPGLLNRLLTNQQISIFRSQTDPHDVDGLRVSLCHISDVVEIIRRVARDGGPSLMNVAAPEFLSIREIAETMSRTLQREASFDVLDEVRFGNLTADTRRLQAAINHDFVAFEDGVAQLLATGKQQLSGIARPR